MLLDLRVGYGKVEAVYETLYREVFRFPEEGVRPCADVSLGGLYPGLGVDVPVFRVKVPGPCL